jgi:GTPase
VSYIIGITGPPGCGKSTLVEKLALEIRKNGKKVGIIAIDPSISLFWRSFHGNRLRMREASEDAGIFIRSMASRGSVGGIARSTSDTIKILEAAGTDYIIVETVGVGQIQTDIDKVAYTVVVVIQPEVGDIIQAMKAGLMEIGDIFIVNKSELAYSDKTVNNLNEICSLSSYEGWKPSIIKTIGTRDTGIMELAKAIQKHKMFLIASKRILQKQKEILVNEVEKIMEEKLKSIIEKKLHEAKIASIIDDVVARKVSTYSAAEKLIGTMSRRS